MARPRPVSLFPLEFELLTVARALVGAISPRSAEYELRTPHELPEGLSGAAYRALGSTLCEGGVLAIMQRGGAWRELSLAAGGIESGRIWETHAPPELVFSEYSYRLLEHLSRSACDDPGCQPFRGFEPQGLGDELVAYLACDLLLAAELPLAALRELPRRHPLVALAFPDVGAESGLEAYQHLMAPAVREPLATLVRALGSDLTRHSMRLHQKKLAIDDPRALAELGAAEAGALLAFVRAAEEAEREDLLGFVVNAGARLVPDGVPRDALGTSWFKVDAERVAARQAARCEATGLLRALVECGRLHAQFRHVGFVDDGYERAQALLVSWEHFGQRGFSRARAALSNIERPPLAESAREVPA